MSRRSSGSRFGFHQVILVNTFRPSLSLRSPKRKCTTSMTSGLWCSPLRLFETPTLKETELNGTPKETVVSQSSDFLFLSFVKEIGNDSDNTTSRFLNEDFTRKDRNLLGHYEFSISYRRLYNSFCTQEKVHVHHSKIRKVGPRRGFGQLIVRKGGPFTIEVGRHVSPVLRPPVDKVQDTDLLFSGVRNYRICC